MGALIALDFTAKHPERVLKLAVLGAAVPMPVSEPLLTAAHADDHAALDMVNVWSHSPRAQLGGNTAPGMWMLGMNMRLMERQRPGVLYADFKACNEYAPDPAAAARIRSPVLNISGSRDRMTPPRPVGEFLARIAHARTLMLEGTGHALMAEQPDAVLDALIGFL
jgi:pimeloyl-ACP methyl ester carboxylesterase